MAQWFEGQGGIDQGTLRGMERKTVGKTDQGTVGGMKRWFKRRLEELIKGR